MNIIYADEVFLLNALIDYLLLLGSARLCAVPYRRKRYILAALFGSAWCCAGLFPGLSFLNKGIMGIVSGGLMGLIAFGKEQKLWRCILTLFCVCAGFGGAVYAACLLRGRSTPVGTVIHVDMGILVLSFALCWVLSGLLLRRRFQENQPDILSVTVEYNGRKTDFTALRDTGNRLYDPLTGKAVLIAEASSVASLFTRDENRALRQGTDAVMTVPGLYLVPCVCFDGVRRLLPAFCPEKIFIEDTERDDLLIAVSPAPIGRDSTYSAIL